MNRIALTGLMKIELPDRTLRFCDGGFFIYEGETYRSDDDVFGTIGRLQTMAESVGDIVPAVVVTLLPPDTTAASEISQPGNQTSRARIIIAEYDADTGVISSGNTEFDGQLDQTILSVGTGSKQLTASIVSLAERLFERNIGNTMNPTWHKSNFPGERGHDNATGLGRPVAWGTEAPPSVRASGGSGSASGFGSSIINQIVNRR
jgi:hypothetical protein